MIRPIRLALSLAIFATPQTAYAFDTIDISKTLGSIQCEGDSKDVPTLQRELTEHNIPVFAADCGSDGMMYIAVCGAPDGKIGIFTIDADDQQKAFSLGFEPLSSLASRTDCYNTP